MAAAKSSADRNILILAFVIIIGCFVFYYFYSRPLTREISAINDEINLLDMKVTAAQQYIGKLNQLKKEINNINQQLEEMKTILPDRRETPEVIRQTNQMAVESGLSLIGFTPEPAIEHQYYEAWPIKLTMEGSFHNLGLFFEKTGNFSRIISIEDLEIQAVAENPKPEKTVQATCKANTYVYLD